MVPETAAALGVFLLLVAPGIVFQLLRSGSRPEAEVSVFRETSIVAFTSLLFSSAAVGILALARAAKPQWMPDPGAWLRQGSAYFNDDYAIVLRAAAAELAIAVVVAWTVHRVLDLAGANETVRRLSNGLLYGGDDRIRPASAWFELFRRDRKSGEHVYVSVETTSGDVYTGYVVGYTADASTPGERELVLGPPITLRRDGTVTDLMQWARLVLTGEQVASLLVTYAEADAQP